MLLGALLSACQQESQTDLAVGNVSTSEPQPEDRFGKGFGQAYRADRNSEPKNVVDGDVVPVSRTAEPIPID
jgi:hypothetical protein